MLSVCICDDEPALCHELHDMLQQCAGHRKLEIFEISSVSELLKNTLHYDVLFLDIRFKDEDAGIEAAKQLRQIGNQAIIIFLTSLLQYAPNGYEAEAFRYLLKPIQKDMLKETMNAAIEKLEAKNYRFSVVSDSGTVIVEAPDISRIESVARRRVIHITGQEIETWETMAKLYSKLPKGQFAYIQKGYVSNLNFIRQVKNNIVTLKNGEQIALGRNYKNDFFVAFNCYVRDGK